MINWFKAAFKFSYNYGLIYHIRKLFGSIKKRWFKNILCTTINCNMYADYKMMCYSELYLRDIKVRRCWWSKEVIFKLKVYQPGVLIGKGGIKINKIKDQVSKTIGCSVRIIIEEWRPDWV